MYIHKRHQLNSLVENFRSRKTRFPKRMVYMSLFGQQYLVKIQRTSVLSETGIQTPTLQASIILQNHQPANQMGPRRDQLSFSSGIGPFF